MTDLLKELNMVTEAKKSEDTKEEKTEKPGTYVGAKFSAETKKKIKAMIKELKVPNPIPSDKLHTTTIFSTKQFEGKFTPLGKIEKPWVGTPTSFEIFTGRDGQNCLVLKYKCDEQTERHKFLMKEYKALYAWPEFKCHLTLSYDCGDFDTKAHKPNDYIHEIVIESEYTEVLNPNWLASTDD